MARRAPDLASARVGLAAVVRMSPSPAKGAPLDRANAGMLANDSGVLNKDWS